MTGNNVSRSQTIEHGLLKQRSRRLLGNVLRRRMSMDSVDGYDDELRYNFSRRSPNFSGKENDFADALEKLKAIQQKLLRAHAHEPGTKLSGSHGLSFSAPKVAGKRLSRDSNANYLPTYSAFNTDKSKPPFLSPPTPKQTTQNSLPSSQPVPDKSKNSARSAISNALFQSMNFKQFKKQNDDGNHKPAQSHLSDTLQPRNVPINVIVKTTARKDDAITSPNGKRSRTNLTSSDVPKPRDIKVNTAHYGHQANKPKSSEKTKALASKPSLPDSSTLPNTTSQSYRRNRLNGVVHNNEQEQHSQSSPKTEQDSKSRIKKVSIATKPQNQISKESPNRNYVARVKLYKQSLPSSVTINLTPVKSHERIDSQESHANSERKTDNKEKIVKKDKSERDKRSRKKNSSDHAASHFSVKGGNAIETPTVAKEQKNLLSVQSRSIGKLSEEKVMKDSTAAETGKSEEIPQFYFPTGKPRPKDELKATMKKISDVCARFQNRTVPVQEMGLIAKACNVSMYWKGPIFHASADSPEATKVSEESIKQAWKRIASRNNDAASRFVALLAKPGRNCLDFEDFLPLLKDIVDSHPGLIFLKDAPEFHTRYMNTVIARIFYVINRSWSGQISASELRKSNFLTVLSLLEEEDDINSVTDYFSYEHFYVIYCKFWELDTDHNLVIDKHDLLGYGDGVLSSRLIDRVLSGAVTRWDTSDHHLGRMSYVDFVWFILSEEDKKTQTSIEYWYRCMDLDGDGFISMYEMEYFYEEQSEKLEQLDIEPLPFEDCVCQILDIVNPSSPGKVSLSDLKKCKMAHVFFDTFFNVAKYLNNEHKDPFNAQNADDGTVIVTSDWDNFAAEEYELLVAEEQSSKLTDLNNSLLEDDGFDLLEEHVKAGASTKSDSKSQLKSTRNNDGIASELNALNFLETTKPETLVTLAQT